MMLQRGSTGKIMYDINKVIQKRGDESFMCYGWYQSNLPNSYKIKKGKGKLALHYELIKTMIFGYHGYSSVNATKKLVAYLRSIKPDVVHLHNIHSGYINIKILSRYLADDNIKVVWTLHDCWAFTGGCSHYYASGCDKWINGCSRCKHHHQYPISFIFDHSKKQWKDKKQLFTSIQNIHFVTPSNWLANQVKQSFLNKYPVSVINNGIDLNIFKPTKSDFREKNNLTDKYVLLAVALPWSKRKGYYELLDLSQMLDDNTVLVMVGLNPNKCRKFKNIIGIERTNNQIELAGLYSSADVFLNPTHEDTFPTTNIEALACGTPVITYNTCGSPEIIDEKTGIVVDDKTAKALYNAINEIKDKHLLKEDCVRRASTNYDKETQFNKYYDIYKAL